MEYTTDHAVPGLKIARTQHDIGMEDNVRIAKDNCPITEDNETSRRMGPVNQPAVCEDLDVRCPGLQASPTVAELPIGMNACHLVGFHVSSPGLQTWTSWNPPAAFDDVLFHEPIVPQAH